ncbi:MAG: hypothetical protein Ct9H300mP15_09260 [Gemmatimonadota bacterium]|nr:MAG: hypothetical protein Ct9H300mP15_09260 [Gemmatimonadota bacterium]
MLISLILGVLNRGATGGPLGAVSVTMAGCLYCGFSLSLCLSLSCFPLLRVGGENPGGALAWYRSDCSSSSDTWIGDAVAFFAGSKWGEQSLRLQSVLTKPGWVMVRIGAPSCRHLWYFVTSPYLVGMPINIS